MTTEAKTKKNTDYSASAVNLTNPPEIAEMLARLYDAQGNASEIQDRIDAAIPAELSAARDANQDILKSLLENIRDAIDEQGSYQDVINGAYALKQRKVSKSYNAEPFEKVYPQFAPAVIVKAVDTAKLNGLIKGGLITEAQLEENGILKVSESFAYIIRV